MNKGIVGARKQWEKSWKTYSQKKEKAKGAIAKAINKWEQDKMNEILEWPKGEREISLLEVTQ